jgi:endogenous inhibitor of DNA gyrase (YacG/DUF329 family)
MSQPARTDRCPICRHPASPEHRPFCSQLCRDRDLLAWLDERYTIPVLPEEEPPSES